VIAAVVFDLDGVLLDSESVWETVRRDFVAARGGQWSDEIQRNLMGMSTLEWAGYLSQQIPDGVAPEIVAADVIARMREQYQRHLPLIDGAREVVTRLGERWPLGLASSSPGELIDDVLSLAGLADTFAVVVSADEVARASQPLMCTSRCASGSAYRQPSASLSRTRATGIRAAHAAGAYVVAVPNRAFPPASDALALATVVVNDLRELTPDTITRLEAPRAPR